MGDHTDVTESEVDSPELAAAKAELDKIRKPKWFGNSMAIRLWIYRVAIAFLLIATTFTTWEAITMEQYTRLLDALLSLSGAGGLVVAKSNLNNG